MFISSYIFWKQPVAIYILFVLLVKGEENLCLRKKSLPISFHFILIIME